MREAGYDSLMHETCVELGFCGGTKDGRPLHVDDFIPVTGSVSAEQFVDWVLVAEGLDSGSDSVRLHRYRERLRAAFLKHMGAEVVDAGQLRWSNV